MASRIQNYLNTILSAVYGRDVRQAIHDAIEECYDDVDTAKTAAEDATTAASNAASRANTARANAVTATNNATNAASNANAAANAANAAAGSINTAITNANSAATAANNAAREITRANTGALALVDEAISNAETATTAANNAADSITATNTGVLDRAEAAIANVNSAADSITNAETGALVRAEEAISSLNSASGTAENLINNLSAAISDADDALDRIEVAINGNADDYDSEDPEYFIGATAATENAVIAANNANAAAAAVNMAINGNSDIYGPEDPEYIIGAIPAAEMAVAAANSIDEAKTAAQKAASEANTAASNASDAASTASVQTEASRIATENARLYGTRALNAALNIEGLIVSAVTLNPDENASVNINTSGSPYSIAFGIPKGEAGAGFVIKGDPYASLSDLQLAHPDPSDGDIYAVGTEAPYDLYRFTGNFWNNMGPISSNVDSISQADIIAIWNGINPSGNTRWLSQEGLYYLIANRVLPALNEKVNAVTGKGLSTNDLTAELLAKYNGYEASINSLVENKVNRVVISQEGEQFREKVLSANDFTDALKNKLSAIDATIDSVLDANSVHPVSNSAIMTGLNSLRASLSAADMTVAQNIAPAYDPSVTYAEGDICVHDNILYRCSVTGGITTAEEWNDQHWTAITVAAKVNGLESALGSVESTLSAINSSKVSKSGDTMTGALSVPAVPYDSNGHQKAVTAMANDISESVTPSAEVGNIWVRAFDIHDANDKQRAYLDLHSRTNGWQGLQIETARDVNGSIVCNKLGLDIDANGNRVVSFSNVEIWRKALGLGTNGELPIPISQGGTNATSESAALTNLGGVAKAGDTMTGRLNIYGETNDDAVLALRVADRNGISFIQAVTQGSSQGLLLSGGAGLILGSGESARNAYEANLNNLSSQTSEALWLLSDSSILLYTGANTIGEATLAAKYDADGSLSTNIKLAKDKPTIIFHDSANIRGTTPSGNIYSQLQFYDAGNNQVGSIGHRQTATKAQQIYISTTNAEHGSSVTNSLSIGVDASGNRTITVAEAEPWIDALGLNSVSVSPTVVSTMPSGVTAVTISGARRNGINGKVVSVTFSVTRNTTSMTSWATIVSGLPAPAYQVDMTGIMPKDSPTKVSDRGLYVRISTGGNLQIAYGTSSSGTLAYTVTMTYIAA